MTLRYRGDVAKRWQNDEYLVNLSGLGAAIVVGCMQHLLTATASGALNAIDDIPKS